MEHAYRNSENWKLNYYIKYQQHIQNNALKYVEAKVCYCQITCPKITSTSRMVQPGT